MSDINLGLCCINTILRDKNIFCSRTVRLETFKNKGMSHLSTLIRQNLNDLITMIEWNYLNNINLMRISSDIFPHKSNPNAPKYDLDEFQELLSAAGTLSRKYGQRLTFHPGQYNVVGTPNPESFANTILDLDWHAEVLDRMECGSDSVIVVHGGGTYGNKILTRERWIEQFYKLPERVQRRLVLENCEKNFNIEDCLYISNTTLVPVVFDTHHYDCYNILHPQDNLRPAEEYIPAILDTWHRRGIKPKFHVSEQRENSQIGAHSDYITKLPDYLMKLKNIDIMIEAKMKEQAIFKLRNTINPIKIYKRPVAILPTSQGSVPCCGFLSPPPPPHKITLRPKAIKIES